MYYLDVEAALPLQGQRRGVETELDPASAVLIIVDAALPLHREGSGGRSTRRRYSRFEGHHDMTSAIDGAET